MSTQQEALRFHRKLLGKFMIKNILMTKFLLTAFCIEAFTQPLDVQAGIFNSEANLIIKAIPGSNINNLVFSGVNFTIRWREDYNVSLGAATSNFGIIKNGNESTYLSSSINYKYQNFSGIPNQNISWNLGEVVTLLTVPVNQTGSGGGIFELAPENFLPWAGEEWYIEIGGISRTNPIFNPPVTNEVPLPVELAKFSAKILYNTSVKLEWETKSETNSFVFEIERKIFKEDENTWTKIGSIAASGNSNSTKIYSFIDSKVYGGSKFTYRLKVIELSGEFDYSDEVQIELVPQEFVLNQNFPNPFNPSTTINFAVPIASNINLSVFNLLGEKITELTNAFFEPGIHTVTFDGKNFASGFYFYVLESQNQIFVKKMQLTK